MKLPSNDQNLIHLHGVGDVVRPVDIDGTKTSFDYLKSLRIYRFEAGQVIDGEAEGDEVCIVFMSGDVTMEVMGEKNHTWEIEGRANPFESAPHVVYLPPHYSYRLTPKGTAEVAYARSSARGKISPYFQRPEDIKTESQPERELRYLLPEAEHLICVETVNRGWSPYPPHKHDQDTENEAGLEQLSYHLFESKDGFALARIFDDDKDEAFVIKHRDTLAIKSGYHTLSITPDASVYQLNIWAGAGENKFKASEQQ